MSVPRSREELWEAAHAALDARRDPLADADLVAGLCEHPDDLADFLRLDAGLRALARPRRRRAWLLLVPAAAAAALALVLWPRAPRAPRSEVLTYRMSLTTETPNSLSSFTLENGALVRLNEERIGRNSDGLPLATLSTSSVTKGLR